MHIKQPHSIQAFHRTPGVKVATSTRGNYTRLKRLNTSKQQQNHCNLQETLQKVQKTPKSKPQTPKHSKRKNPNFATKQPTNYEITKITISLATTNKLNTN